MLSTLFLILKIVCIVVLAVIGLALSVILLALFVPVRYRFWCSYGEGVRAKVKVTWLWHLLSVLATYDQSMKFTVRLLGFPLGGSKKGKTEDESQEDEEWEFEMPDKQAGQTNQEETTAEGAEEKPGGRDEGLRTDAPEPGEQNDALLQDADGYSEEVSQKKRAALDETAKDRKEKRQKTQKVSPKRPFEGIVRILRTRFQALCDKIKTVEEKRKAICDFFKDPANQKSIRQILRMVKHILPRKLTGSVVFGFEDPSVTGQVSALLSFAYARYGDALSITPVFDESVLEAEGKGRGRIFLGVVLFWCVRVLMNRNFRKLLFKRRRKRDGGE